MTDFAQDDWTDKRIAAGDLEALRRRIMDEPDYLNTTSKWGTPLEVAVDYGNLEVVRFMLEAGADPNVEPDDGYTCLLTAIDSSTESSILIMQALIDGGADIQQAGTNGWTPLHMAAVRGYVEKANVLIQAGAKIDQRTEIDGDETPLMLAASTGKADVVRLLLQHDADPTLRETMLNKTPLEIAIAANKGPDMDVYRMLKGEPLIDIRDVFDGEDLPTESMEHLQRSIPPIDLAESYLTSSKQLVENGDHAQVIEVLNEWMSS